MSIEIVVPQVGEAISAARLVQWYKAEGDFVREGEPLFAVDTDKAVLDVEAFSEGILAKILIRENSDVQPGMVVGLLQGRYDDPIVDAAPPAPAVAPVSEPLAPLPMKSRPNETGRADVSPKAKRLARELGVDLAALAVRMPGKMITEDDVRAAARGPSS